MSEPVLNYQWMTEHPLDAEQKQYVLLAYLQNIREKFSGEILFPHLSEVIAHIRNLETIGEGFKSLEDDFPKELTGFDPKTLTPVFSRKQNRDNVFSFIRDLIDFAKPRLSHTASIGKEIFDEVEHHLQIQTIGLLPVVRHEGYLLIGIDGAPEVHIFRFSVSSISLSSEKYRSMSMQWVMSDSLSLSNSPQHIKLNLIKKFPELPNPAAFVCTSLKPWPFKETLLPVTKRLLLRTILATANPQS